MKEICPNCFCGRVGSDGAKPTTLNNTFSDCKLCGGTGIKQELKNKS